MTRSRRECRAAMAQATAYTQWLQAAREHDHLTGVEAWMADDASPHYDAKLLRRDLQRLQKLKAAGQIAVLIKDVQESLYRHLNDLHAPQLYDHALSGTKHLIRDYLRFAEQTMEFLAETDIPGFSVEAKLQEFERAYHTFGRSALLLSGGATLGFYHLGVVKALFDAQLLPRVISGASMGAMIAAGICSRTPLELAEMFADPSQIQGQGLAWASPREILRNRAILDPAKLLGVIRHNMSRDFSFAEAFAHSGRVLNISLSPTRSRQKPRILSHISAPSVMIAEAALASSAIPGVFPPVSLTARGSQQSTVPYLPTEAWIDGSFGGDLPMQRLGRLHNVNHFIVSQTNPHVLPFTRQQGGIMRFGAGMFGSAIRAQGVMAVGLARRVADAAPLRMLHALASQEYRGDITIYPRVDPLVYRKMLANPTPQELRWFIAEGERATWPRLAMIRDHTRISRTFERCVLSLRAQLAGRSSPDHK